jgi:hypothetical protein
MGAAAALAAPVSAYAARPVEGYRSPDGRVGCVLYQAFNEDGNAVKCGRRGSARGLLLPSAGPARSMAWRWPARQLGRLFFTARYNQTLYLYGGTAKLEGDETILRCVFRRGRGVRCTNGDVYAIVVTRTGARRISP